MIPPEKAAEILAICISRQQDAIEELRAQGHEAHDIVLIHYHGYPRLYRLENGLTKAEDCFEVRPARADDKLMGTQTEQGFWLRWAIDGDETMVYEIEM